MPTEILGFSIPFIIGVIAFTLIHIFWYIQPSPIASPKDLVQTLHNGKPTIIEFYSNL